jgi:hypothetical protein
MAKKRSSCGIVLTIIGVVLIIAGATTGWWYEGARPGFHEHQMIVVAIGLLLLIIGAVMCGKCKCLCAAGAGDEPEEDSAEAPEAAEEASSE